MSNYKSLKRRLPINDSIELSEVRQPEANPEDDSDDEENTETNLIKFEQGVSNKGNVVIWHAGLILYLYKILYFSF